MHEFCLEPVYFVSVQAVIDPQNTKMFVCSLASIVSIILKCCMLFISEMK